MPTIIIIIRFDYGLTNTEEFTNFNQFRYTLFIVALHTSLHILYACTALMAYGGLMKKIYFCTDRNFSSRKIVFLSFDVNTSKYPLDVLHSTCASKQIEFVICHRIKKF